MFFLSTESHMLCPHPLLRVAQPVTQVGRGEAAAPRPSQQRELGNRDGVNKRVNC